MAEIPTAVGRWRRFAAAICAALLLSAHTEPARAEERASELAVKATYLHKLLPFVQWPTGAFRGPEEPFRICVLGPDPFGPLLDRAVAGQRPADRPIQVLRVQTAAEVRSCHVLYLGQGQSPEDLHAIGRLPILTVTDESAAPSVKGIVHFDLVRNRVGFHIDDIDAKTRGLGLSSKLLQLALSLTSNDGGEK